MSKSAGNGFQTPYVGRGVAFVDFDNDGFVDVVVANNGDVPLLLHNSGGNGNHFLNFKLVGTKSNRDAMGARIRILAGGISQIREIEGGGSYLSQSDLRANFGLGKTARAETVEVKWPSGLATNIPQRRSRQILSNRGRHRSAEYPAICQAGQGQSLRAFSHFRALTAAFPFDRLMNRRENSSPGGTPEI